MKKRLWYLILPLATLVLELLPYGAVCNFANPEGEPWRETFSYFDLLPFGYANFAPLLTALLSCVILLLVVIYCITGRHALAATARTMLAVATVLSLCPLLYGIRYFSLVGALISLSLAGEFLALLTVKKADRQK